MKIKVFAVLKDFMPVESEVESVSSVSDLIALLKLNYPDAATILSQSRVATNTAILKLDDNITAYEELCIIPPSSGG
ncbi:MAG: MoaD/ThiS family protein [Cytophagaceae bacterium]